MTRRLIVMSIIIVELILWTSVNAEDVIRFAIYHNPPQLFSDEKGQARGMVADVLQFIASEEGWTIEYVPCDAKECLDQLQSGEIDLMCPIAFNEKRTKVYDFTTEVFLSNWAQVYATPESEIQSILDLEGKKIAAIDGIVLTGNLRKLLKSLNVESTFIGVHNFSDVLDLIDQKKVDAGIMNRMSMILNKGEYNVKQTPIIFSPVEIRFASPKNKHKDLLATIDRYLIALKDDKGSIYHQSFERHLGILSEEAFPKWFQWTLRLSIATAVLFLGASVLLRSQVKARTKKLVKEIEAHQKAEEALLKSEDHLREQFAELEHIYNTSPLGLCFMDTDLRFIRINEKLAAINGPSVAEHIGRTLKEVIPGIAHQVEIIYQRVIETGEPVPNFEIHGVTPADHDVKRDWSVSIYPVKADDGALLGVGTVVQDITERKQAENLLRKSEEKYRFLADNVTDALWILEIDKLKLNYVSPSIERIQGYTPEEIMKIPIHKNFTPQSFELMTELISEELAKEEAGRADLLRPTTVELELYCKDGSSKWTEVTARIIRTENNKATGLIGVIRDISERKHAEKERKHLAMQLQQAQKMEAIGTLAGGIAHDFNNILAAIFGYTELALGEAKTGTLQYENLQEALRAGYRAKDLIQQILAFSRQADQEKQPVQVKLIVREALSLLRASIPTTIKIDQNVKSNALVMGESTQIHQIIMNLCTNAAHAMAQKGGVLTINLSDTELDSEFAASNPELKPGPYINLTVTDTGHGMTLAVLEKIFDPFFTTKEKGAGTGMGLSVAHGIVNSYGGTVYAESEPGKGATFHVFLPAIERSLLPEGKIEQPVPTGAERILFIDDEPAIANMAKQILESLGYDVVTRTSSIEALEMFKIQKSRFDLVITDMTMPQMTGENLARELIRIRPDVRIILCTGFSARIDEKKAMTMGIRAFIFKPILKREIAEVIRAVLDGE